jgi:hypothetical protein
MEKENNKIVYLIDKNVCEVGFRFVYHNVDACKKCGHKDLCTGKLVEGRVYEVLNILKTKKKIICPITENEMSLAEVSLASIHTSLSTKKAVENIVTSWSSPICENYNCEYREICFPKGLIKGDKVRVKKVEEKISCPLKYNLTHVTVQPLL